MSSSFNTSSSSTAPKFGQPVIHKEQDHKPAEALDKLAGPDTSILTSLVRSASQAGGAAYSAALNTAHSLQEKAAEFSHDAALLASDLGKDAALLASSTKDQALSSLAAAKDFTAETLDSAKHIASDKAADLSASAQSQLADLSIDAQHARANLEQAASYLSDKASELSTAAQEKAFELSATAQEKAFELSAAAQEKASEIAIVAQEKALEISTIAQEKAAELTSDLSIASWAPSSHRQLPYLQELIARYESGSRFSRPILPFRHELLSRTSEGFKFARTSSSRSALPFLSELCLKVPAIPSAAPLAFSRPSSRAASPAKHLGDELFAQEKVERDLKADSASGSLKLTMEVVAHLQRIADRTGDSVLHETARKAHSAFARGLSEAPGVHLTNVNSQQANELLNLAIQTQNRELADFARYCQSVADTTHVAVEPTPGKILQEIEKGRELLSQGRVHTGPGYGAAFASVDSKAKRLSANLSANAALPPAVPAVGIEKLAELAFAGTKLELTMDVVAHIQRIADRTGDALLHETARRAHSACAKGLQEAPGVHLTWVTPQQANELLNLAIQTQDRELADFARYCQSVAATTQVAVEPVPGKILQEIEKGRQELQSQGRIHTGPGYGAAFASVANAQGQRVKQENRKSASMEKPLLIDETLSLIAEPVGKAMQ